MGESSSGRGGKSTLGVLGAVLALISVWRVVLARRRRP